MSFCVKWLQKCPSLPLSTHSLAVANPSASDPKSNQIKFALPHKTQLLVFLLAPRLHYFFHSHFSSFIRYSFRSVISLRRRLLLS